MTIRPLLLSDYEKELPEWTDDVLTPRQADVDLTSAPFRYRKLIFASDLTAPAKLVALCVADSCDGDFKCTLKGETLARRTGYSRRTVLRAVEVLEDRGWLHVRRETYSELDQRRRANTYSLAWPAQNGRQCARESRHCVTRSQHGDTESHEHGVRESHKGTSEPPRVS